MSQRSSEVGSFEEQACARLEPGISDYIAGGAEDEITLVENQRAWDAMRLRPRVLRDVREVRLETEFLGRPVSTPVGIAPMAMQHAMWDEGAVATSRVAAETGSLFVMSLFGAGSAAEAAAVDPAAPRWLQVYVLRDRERSMRAIERTLPLGYQALMLTVDVVRQGKRPRDLRNRFEFFREEDGVHEDPNEIFDHSLRFEDIAWFRERAGVPLIIKGVLRGDDARACAEAGADAVVVSNHGGRQLDTALATAHALSEVVAAVDGRAEVYVDGGLRRGHHVVKALALGARGVFVGRPVLWGLAARGAAGVRAVLDELSVDVERSMALCGARSVSEIDASLLAPERAGRG